MLAHFLGANPVRKYTSQCIIQKQTQKKIKEKKIHSQLENVDFICAYNICCCGKGMRIGDCLFNLRFFVLFCFWCMKKLQGSNISGFFCLQERWKLCAIMPHIPMYRGQAIIYPSMYSLNILLYNKDYKTSNIHR